MAIQTAKTLGSKKRVVAGKGRLVTKRRQGVMASLERSHQSERLHIIVSITGKKWNVVPDSSHTPLKSFDKKADAVRYSIALQPHRRNIVVHNEEGGVDKRLID